MSTTVFWSSITATWPVLWPRQPRSSVHIGYKEAISCVQTCEWTIWMYNWRPDVDIKHLPVLFSTYLSRQSLTSPRTYQLTRLAGSENLLALPHPTLAQALLVCSERGSHSVSLACRAGPHQLSHLPPIKSLLLWSVGPTTGESTSSWPSVPVRSWGYHASFQRLVWHRGFAGWNEDLTGPDSGQQEASLVINCRLCRAQTSQGRLG